MLKKLFKQNKKISILTIIGLLIIIVGFLCYIFRNKIFVKISNNSEISNDKRISISKFSDTLNIGKEGNLLPYPEITIFSDADGKISNINVSEGDFVKKGKILMTIKDTYDDYSAEIENSQFIIDNLQGQYNNKKSEYESIELSYLEKIEELKDQISYIEDSISYSILQGDNEGLQVRTNQIENIEKQISSIQVEQGISKQNYISEMNNIENEIKMERNKYDMYYNKLNQLTPRATIDGIISHINISQGDNVYDGDILLNIMNINKIPEISVELDFDEYLLTENITGASIVINLKDGDQYFIQEFSGITATRNPTINENEKYEITLQIPDFSGINITNVNDVGIIFHVKSDGLRIDDNCVNYSGNDSSFINLYDGIREWSQDITVLTRLDNQVLIDDKWLFIQNDINSINNDLEKSGLNLQEIDSLIENDILNLSDFYQNLQILCEN